MHMVWESPVIINASPGDGQTNLDCESCRSLPRFQSVGDGGLSAMIRRSPREIPTLRLKSGSGRQDCSKGGKCSSCIFLPDYIQPRSLRFWFTLAGLPSAV